MKSRAVIRYRINRRNKSGQEKDSFAGFFCKAIFFIKNQDVSFCCVFGLLCYVSYFDIHNQF